MTQSKNAALAAAKRAIARAKGKCLYCFKADAMVNKDGKVLTQCAECRKRGLEAQKRWRDKVRASQKGVEA